MFKNSSLVAASLLTFFLWQGFLSGQVTQLDSKVAKMAARKGMTKQLDEKRELLSQIQVSSANIKIKKLADNKVFLAPYCTLAFGENIATTEWMLNKQPPVFIGQVKKLGHLLVVVMPPQDANVTAADIYAKYSQKVFKELDLDENSKLNRISDKGRVQQFRAMFSGTHKNGNSVNACIQIVLHENFALLIQAFGKDKPKREEMVKILDTIEFDHVTTSKPKTAEISLGNSAIAVPNPDGLVCATDKFPQMIAVMNRVSPTEVEQVYVEPTATQATWSLNGLYRNADATIAGKMSMLEYLRVKREFDNSLTKGTGLASSPNITIEKMDCKPSGICYFQTIKMGNKTRVGAAGLWYHNDHLVQFCVHSDLRTDEDAQWVKSTLKNWLKAIQRANQN